MPYINYHIQTSGHGYYLHLEIHAPSAQRRDILEYMVTHFVTEQNECIPHPTNPHAYTLYIRDTNTPTHTELQHMGQHMHDECVYIHTPITVTHDPSIGSAFTPQYTIQEAQHGIHAVTYNYAPQRICDHLYDNGYTIHRSVIDELFIDELVIDTQCDAHTQPITGTYTIR